MGTNKELKTILVPKKLIHSIIEVQTKWEQLSDELEDFLLSLNKRFIKKMEKARKEHLKGKIRNLEELKRELE